MTERQAFNYHKLKPIPIIALLACLSISSAYGQVTNPSTGDTIAKYCSNGICHTPGGPTVKLTQNSLSVQPAPEATAVGKVKLSQPCIGNNCSKVTQVKQLGKIGIQLVPICITELKNHINSTCLDYNIIKPFDNTNPLWAGLWVEQPYEHRLNPKIKNHENFNPNPWSIMVDPNPDYTINAKMIYVNNDNFTWINPDQTSNKGIVMITHMNRYVSPNCNDATVAPNINLINDTIFYLESGCKTTSYNDTKIITQKEIAFSFNNPYSSLHYKDQVSSVKKTGGLGNCISQQCSYTDPYKKSGW